MDDPDFLLNRREGAAALKSRGFKVAPTSLATMASRGGGPKFRKFGRIPLYRWGDLLEWAQSRLGPVVSSTSELDRRGDRPAPTRAAVDTELTAA
jgi:hypothetical protein